MESAGSVTSFKRFPDECLDCLVATLCMSTNTRNRNFARSRFGDISELLALLGTSSSVLTSHWTLGTKLGTALVHVFGPETSTTLATSDKQARVNRSALLASYANLASSVL